MSASPRDRRRWQGRRLALTLTAVSVLAMAAIAAAAIRESGSGHSIPVKAVTEGHGATASPTSTDRSTPSTTGPPEPGMQLAFRDDFDGSTLDRSKWRYCYPWASETGCTNATNFERQWYVPDQVSVSGGSLHLTAAQRSVTGVDDKGDPTPYSYVSGLVTSDGHFDFTYGYVRFRARLPTGAGLWPALWLIPSDHSWPPEIDVLEAKGSDPGTVHQYLHPRTGAQAEAITRGVSAGWHTFAVDWEPDSLTFYIDGTRRLRVTRGVPDRPMYLVMNVAIGGWAGDVTSGTRFPASLDVDQVEVWTQPSSNGS